METWEERAKYLARQATDGWIGPDGWCMAIEEGEEQTSEFWQMLDEAIIKMREMK